MPENAHARWASFSRGVSLLATGGCTSFLLLFPDFLRRHFFILYLYSMISDTQCPFLLEFHPVRAYVHYFLSYLHLVNCCFARFRFLTVLSLSFLHIVTKLFLLFLLYFSFNVAWQKYFTSGVNSPLTKGTTIELEHKHTYYIRAIRN